MGDIQKVEQQNLPLDQAREQFEILIKSAALPAHIKNTEMAYTVAKMGRELGFDVMQAFHYIVPIQGRLSLSAKAIGALLRKGGIAYQTLEDALYVYPDGKTSDLSILGDQKPVNRRTTIKFVRNGMEEICSFTWVDAEKQGLTNKDNWKRMPKEMLWARCLSKGANRVGSDLLLGLYSTDELLDTFGTGNEKVIREEDGTVIEIIDENKV